MMYLVEWMVSDIVVLAQRVFLTKEQKERLECEDGVVVTM